MSELIIQYIVRFILVILTHLFVVSGMEVHTWFNPLFYSYFILFLPINISAISLFILSFLTGFSVDIFESTGGIHASALLFLSLARKKVLNLFVNVDDLPEMTEPNLKIMSQGALLLYIAIMVGIHHIIFFSIENIGLLPLLTFLMRWLISSVVSVVLIFSIYLIFSSKKQ